jgi:hypothetical protein
MAKASSAATSIADQVTVAHHCTPEASPGQAEVLVAGKRVAYIGYGPGFPISFLPADYLGFRMLPSELKKIIAVAQDQVVALADAELKHREELAEIMGPASPLDVRVIAQMKRAA